MKRALQNTTYRVLFFLLLCCGAAQSAAQTADFTINTAQGCVPLGGVNFTDASTGGTVINRDWDLGNGTLIPNGAATVGTNYLTAGTFNITLTVTFQGGTVRSVTKNVVVHPKPLAAFSAADTAGCAPHLVSFQDLSSTATGSINSWQWDFGAGGSTLQNPSFTYNTTGLYNVSLIVTNSWGCQSDAATRFQYIRVYTRPTAAFTATPFFGCKDSLTVSFNNTTTGGSPANTWLWNFGDGSTSTQKNPTHFYAAPGTYTVTLTASVGSSCSHTTTRTVYVGNVTPFFITAPDTVCINVPTTFSGSATPAPFSVQWIFSDNGAIQNGATTSHTFANPGDYTVTLIAFTAQGCSDTITKPIHVKAGAGLTPFFINAPDTVCVNNPTQYSGSSTPAPALIRWYFADNGAIQTGSPTTHSFSPPGDYLVSLYVYDSRGCADTISKTVHVKTGPAASFTPDKVNGCGVPFTVTFTNTTPGNNLQFTWNFGDGSPLVTTNGPLTVPHTYNSFGNFTVTLTARDTVAGCSGATASVLIRNYQPSVDFTYVPPSGCKPLPVFFTAQVSNLIVPVLKYVWNYGDGSPLDSVNVPNGFHLYTAAGVYLASLTIVTAECVYTTVLKPVTVVNICDDDGSGGGGAGGAGFLVGKTCTDKYTVTFTDTVTANKVTIAWNFGDGSPWYTTPPLNPVTHTYSPPQKDYIVSVVRLDTITGLTDTAQKRVIIIDEKANFLPNVTDICANGTVFFSTVGIDSSKINLYTWDFGDGTPRQVINNGLYYSIFGLYLNGNTSHVYADTGLYYVKLIITDRLGCVDSFMYPVPIRVSSPAAAFGFDVQLSCLLPMKVVFTDSSRQNGSNVIVNRQWNFGDGSPVYNTTLDTAIGHFYNVGTYTVRLTVTDAIGCTSTTTRTVVVPLVNTGPQAGFSANPLTSCSSPQMVTFTDTSRQSGAIPITEWTWTFGDGSPVLVNTVDTPVNHIYTGNNYVNFYNVTLRVKDSIGCVSTITKPAYIRLYAPRANFFSFDTLKCGSYNVFLYNTSSAYNATYTWYYGDGTSSTGFYGSHTYATEGQYDIKLVVRDENGCLDSITKPAYIKLVRPKAGFRIGDTTRCAPAAIIFTDSSQYATAWQWDFGDGGTGSTDQNPAPKIYPLPGFYKVTLRITGLNGCVDSISKWIRVRGPIASLQAPPAAGCKPLVFNALVQGTFINTYAWDFGDGTPVNASVSDSVISHTYIRGGKYLPNVVLVSPEGCPLTLKATDSVIVDSARALFAPLSSTFCGSGTVYFTNLSRTTNFSSFTAYAWDFGDGSPVDNNAVPAPHPFVPGNYTVSLAVTTQYGCTDTFRRPLAVVVHPLPVPAILGDSIRCRPGSYTYTSSISSVDRIQQFSWYVNGVPVSADSNLTYPFVAGNYNLKLVVRTINGCTDSVSRNIIVDFVAAVFSVTNPVRCADNLTVQFNNSSGSQFGTAGYLWTFGDGSTSTAANPPPHVYPGYGSYTASLLVVTVHGCRDSMTISPAVVIHPLPDVTGIEGDSIRCRPGTYSYTSRLTTLDRIQQFSWYVNGSPASTDSNLIYTFAPGVYGLKLVVRTINGCTDSSSRIIIVDSVKAAFTVVNPVRCADNLSVLFSNTSSAHFGPVGYVWNFGDGNGSTLQNPPPHSYPGFGSYNASLLAVSVHGCRDSMTISPAVVIHPLPDVTGIEGDSIRCRPGTYSYTSRLTTLDRIQQFSWRVNGVPVSSDSNLTRYFNAGHYTIQLVVRTVNGCTDSISRSIIVDSVRAAFSAVNPIRCGNDRTVQFINQSGSYQGISSWLWNFGDFTTSTQQNPPPHVYAVFGAYNVSLLAVSVHGCRDSIKIDSAVVINRLPTPSIDGDSIRCKPGTWLYRSVNNTLDNIQEYRWKVNGLLVSSSKDLLYNFAAGTYRLDLRVTTDKGCTDSVSRNIIIDSVRARFAVDRPIRCGDNDLTVNFSNLSGGKFDIIGYAWQFGDGQGTTLTAPVHTYAAAGTYNVQLIATSEHGCTDTALVPAAVVIYKTPTLAISGPPDRCMGGVLQFTSQVVSEDGITAYQWKVNGVPAGSSTNLNYLFTVAGNYMITLDIATAYGCAVSDTLNVVIHPLPIPNALPNTTICEGSTAQLRAYDGVNYEWTPAATLQNANTDSPIASPVQDTWYRVKVTNQFGCEQLDSVLIRVDKKINLTVNTVGPVCRGQQVQLRAAGNTTQFAWSPVAGLSNPNSAITFAAPDSTTVYTATGISSNACPSESANIVVTIGQIPTVNIGPDLQLTAGTPVTLQPVYTNGVTQYLWTPSTGLSCISCPQPSFVADKSITYRVQVRTQFGCTATDEVNINVLCGKGSVFIPNSFTPNNDGLNDVFYVSGYGVARVKRFLIYDRWGKLIFQQQNIPAGDRNYGWDGRVLGNEVTTTTAFVYIVEAECVGGGQLDFKGSVLLIR